MARSAYHLSNEQWAELLVDATHRSSKPKSYVEILDKLYNMTHHERRLFIRRLMRDVSLYHAVRKACTT